MGTNGRTEFHKRDFVHRLLPNWGRRLMPLYAYRCRSCAAEQELLQALGADAPPCTTCGAATRKVYGRVAVRYGTWGFRSTDGLVAETRGKDFKALRDRAERIAEG